MGTLIVTKLTFDFEICKKFVQLFSSKSIEVRDPSCGMINLA